MNKLQFEQSRTLTTSIDKLFHGVDLTIVLQTLAIVVTAAILEAQEFNNFDEEDFFKEVQNLLDQAKK